MDVLHVSQAYGTGLRMGLTKSMISTFATCQHPPQDTISTKLTTSTGTQASTLTLLTRSCRYRHGIKVLFQPHGQLGQGYIAHELCKCVTQCRVAVSIVKITETILQGVVLFGMATTITTFIASYLAGYVFAGKSTRVLIFSVAHSVLVFPVVWFP